MTTKNGTQQQTNPVLARLLATLDAQTAATLRRLEALDDEIYSAFLDAEAAAEAKVAEYAAEIEGNLERRLAGFQARVLDMTADAVEGVLGGIARRLDLLAETPPGEPVLMPLPADATPDQLDGKELVAEESAEVATTAELLAQAEAQLAEATAVAAELDEVQGEIQAELNDLKAEYDEYEFVGPPAPPETATPVEVAAQAVEPDGDLAVLTPEDDGDEAGDDQPEDDAACDAAYVYDAEGLHAREETGGRRAKYVPVGHPVPGEEYWVRKPNRHWKKVIYVG